MKCSNILLVGNQKMLIITDMYSSLYNQEKEKKIQPHCVIKCKFEKITLSCTY